jgi:kynurenine formamidase
MSPNRVVHDLTALLETHMPVWPTSPLPVFEPVGLLPRDGYSLESIHCSSHTGTHMDAPYHFVEGGLTVDRIPPGQLVGSAAVLDLREGLQGTRIDREMLQRRWPRSIRPDIVLLETGWSRERARTRRYLYDFPGLTPDAAAWAADQGIHGIGTDTLGIDPFDNTEYEAHKVLLKRGIWVLEALDHLDALQEGTEYTLVAAPLKLSGGSGAMARVLAWES